MYVPKALVFAVLLASSVAHAGGPQQFFGRWEEKHELGSMVVAFSAKNVSQSQLDSSGKPIRLPLVYSVTYQKLGPVGGKETFGVNFKSPDGKPGGGIMVIVQDANHILMDFPGVGAHPLERLKSK
jgi:hypothetical protein